MTTTTTTTTTPTTFPATAAHAATARRSGADISARLTGAAALGFGATVVAQNIIRGGAAPANDAPATEVLTHYADHRALTFVLVSTFVVGGLSLATFLGGAARQMLTSVRRGWAITGVVGAVGVLGLFAVLVSSEEALSVMAGRDQPDVSAIEAVWTLHNSIFTVLLLSIAVALLGLSRGGVAAGITPRVFDRLAPIGSGLLVVGTLAGPAIAAGENMAFFGVSVVGFAVWLAFLSTTGVRLVRSAGAR
ncbi:MAG: hypothetical protein HZB15_15390 [Actinobacteria bacterium]|nr:hypothetical protein [Actinomycetota bacterium]